MISRDEAFGEWLKARRKAKGWTQEELARQLTDAGWAVTRNWVNRVEKGAVASEDFHRAAEDLLGRYDAPATTSGLANQDELVKAMRDQTASLERSMKAIERGLLAQADAINGLVKLFATRDLEREVAEEFLGSLGLQGVYTDDTEPEHPTAPHPEPTATPSQSETPAGKATEPSSARSGRSRTHAGTSR